MGLPVQFGMKPLRFEQLFRAFYCTLLDVKGDNPAFFTHKLTKKSGVIAPPCRGVDAGIPFTDIFGDILMNQCQCVHRVSSRFYCISIPQTPENSKHRFLDRKEPPISRRLELLE